MSDPQLMSLFDFDESELYANRNGRLSERQKTRLAQAESSSKGCNGILGAFLMLVALIGLAIAVSAGPAAFREDRTAAIMLGLGFGCFWPLVWGSFGLSSIRRVFAKMEVTVKKAEGSINIVREPHSRYNSSTKMRTEETIYELHIGGRTFEVGSSLADVMMQGSVYAVYYADFNLEDKEDEILSADLLSKASGAFTPAASSLDDVEVVEYLKKGDLLEAIKAYRAIHDSSFEDAKSIVEQMQARLGY